jgi:hypothetical protein
VFLGGGLISNAWVEDGTIAMPSSIAGGAEGSKGEVETASSVVAGDADGSKCEVAMVVEMDDAEGSKGAVGLEVGDDVELVVIADDAQEGEKEEVVEKGIGEPPIIVALEDMETLPSQIKNEPMTALKQCASRPDASSTSTREGRKKSSLATDFLVGGDKNSLLTDGDSVTTCASEEMVCCFPGTRLGNGTRIEEHELGPSPVKNPGPPFKVGDVILCDVPGQFWGMDPKVAILQRGFVMEAADPWYKIRLEQGATVWTNTREFWLKSR